MSDPQPAAAANSPPETTSTRPSRANLLATALLRTALVFLIMLANDRELMGPKANSRALNAVAVAAAAYAVVAAVSSLAVARS